MLTGKCPMLLRLSPHLMNGTSNSGSDSDDQGKVWVNGKEVFSHTKAFMAIVDTYTIPVKLKPGRNSILVKVCNEMGGWAFFLRITDEDGQSSDDLIINSAIQNAE